MSDRYELRRLRRTTDGVEVELFGTLSDEVTAAEWTAAVIVRAVTGGRLSLAPCGRGFQASVVDRTPARWQTGPDRHSTVNHCAVPSHVADEHRTATTREGAAVELARMLVDAVRAVPRPKRDMSAVARLDYALSVIEREAGALAAERAR